MNAVSRYRMRVLAIVGLSMFVALTARLWYLQVMVSEEAMATARSNITRVIPVPAPRGRILDVNGHVLVGNRTTTVLTMNRHELGEAGFSDAETQVMLTEIAIEINRSGQLVKVSDVERALKDPSYGRYDDVPIAHEVGGELLVFFGERPHRFPGVRVTESTVRSYLYGDLASHVLGWVGPVNDAELRVRRPPVGKEYRLRDRIGKAGVELMFENDLRGVAGRKVVEVDRLGEIVRERNDLFVPPLPGNDIVLTLDVDIQYLVERELERSILLARTREPDGDPNDPSKLLPTFDAPGGAVVLLDPMIGSVVAMASYPTYDPNDSIGGFSLNQWAELNDPANDLPMFNRAIQGEYAPGSTFKLFTAHAAWHEGVFGVGAVPRADELWDDPGAYVLRACGDVDPTDPPPGCRYRNAGEKRYDSVDLVRSLTVSSDVYYYRIGESIYTNPGHSDTAIQDAAAGYGLGLESGVTLPFEQKGYLPTPTNRRSRHEANPVAFPEWGWSTGDNVITAIGQGEVLVTPLQLANAFAIFANGGVRFAPNVVDRVLGRDGELVRTFGPRALSTVDIDPSFRNRVVRGLAGVTADEEGTAYWAFNSEATDGVYFPLEEFPIAAKTGTAEVRGKADTSIFAAFGPAEMPTHTMVAVLEEAGFGSSVAAPLVARVLEKVLEDTVPNAPLAAERYARSTALPLCVAWHQWRIGNTLDRLEEATPASNDAGGPVLDASGKVLVRGIRVDCEDLIKDVLDVFDAELNSGGSE
ncbi:MAG: penicillin-binding transpeptidase domain-containing protein [Acidimicrobiales bacterium]|nr:penicillin-binding transpeptidase domain-containing protein [Acidimicrobiales bacterium]